MFKHSVKVPRHYKVASNIFKKVSLEGGSVKTLLYDDKLRHFRTNVLYALISETIKHAAHLDKLFENCGLFEKESRLDPWLAKILTTELLFGKKNLPGKSKPEQTILSYKEQFEKYTSENEDISKTEVVRRPRYVRVNTNLLTTSDAIRAFQDEGYCFVRCTAGSYDDYLQQIQQLNEYDFTQDYHVKTVFVFASGTKLHDHELYLENKIILQDKATALAAHLLAPPAGSSVLDMCAAPGMKTTQLAAFMRNQGRIYAVERNEKRYQTLCEFVERTESKCVKTLHRDSLDIRRGELDDVEYILLDPSCSGSGMELCVHNYIEETRLAKLTSLQEKFLKHAMNAFPKAKRIVYSTCSLFPEENERVITNVVKTSRSKWRVQDVKEMLKGQWNNIGSGMYGSMGTRCMYAKPESDLTIGFFLAVLDRDQKELDRLQNIGKVSDIKDETEENNTVDGENENSNAKEQIKKKNKIKGTSKESESNELQNEYTRYVSEDPLAPTKATELVDETQPNLSDDEGVIKKKKKKNKKEIEADGSEETLQNETIVANDDLVNENKTKKRKKAKLTHDEENTESHEDTNNELVVKQLKKKSKNKDIPSENHDIVENVIDEPKKKKKKRHENNIES